MGLIAYINNGRGATGPQGIPGEGATPEVLMFSEAFNFDKADQYFEPVTQNASYNFTLVGSSFGANATINGSITASGDAWNFTSDFIIMRNDYSDLDAGYYDLTMRMGADGKVRVIIDFVAASAPPVGAPNATNVAFTGTETVGSTLTGSHGEPSGYIITATAYKWYVSDDNTGTNESAISGATSSTYELTLSEEGKVIRRSVQLTSAEGTGDEVFSAYSGTILAENIWTPNDLPGVKMWLSAKKEAERRELGESSSVDLESWTNEVSGLSTEAVQSTAGMRPILINNSGRWIVNFVTNKKLYTLSDLYGIGDQQYSVFVNVEIKEIKATSSTNILQSYSTGGVPNKEFIFAVNNEAKLRTGWYFDNLIQDEPMELDGIKLLSTFYDGSSRDERINNVSVASDSASGYNFTPNPTNGVIGDEGTQQSMDYDVTDIIIVRGKLSEENISKVSSYVNSAAYDEEPISTFVYVSDLHKSSLSNNVGLDRYRLDANDKLSDMIDFVNSDSSIDFVIMNGDMIDRGDSNKTDTLADLANIEGLFSTLNKPRYYSFGNHDLDNISKSEFIANTGMTDPYYSFDKNGIHYIVLDSCYFEEDDSKGYDTGNFNYQNTWINPTQKSWLISDLAGTTLPCIVFLHNQLDGLAYPYPVGNRTDIRTILEDSGKVKNVIQGHVHKNFLSTFNGINYISMNAICMDEYPATSYAKVRVYADGSINVEGFGAQDNY